MLFPFYFSSHVININLFKEFELIRVKNYTRCKDIGHSRNSDPNFCGNARSEFVYN
jgi:hypothetical protein